MPAFRISKTVKTDYQQDLASLFSSASTSRDATPESSASRSRSTTDEELADLFGMNLPDLRGFDPICTQRPTPEIENSVGNTCTIPDDRDEVAALFGVKPVRTIASPTPLNISLPSTSRSNSVAQNRFQKSPDCLVSSSNSAFTKIVRAEIEEFKFPKMEEERPSSSNHDLRRRFFRKPERVRVPKPGLRPSELEKIQYYKEKYGVTLNLEARMDKTYETIKNVMKEKEVQCDFFNRQIEAYWRLYKAADESKNRKAAIRDHLADLIKEIFPSGYLALGGSTMNGCGTLSSDLDLCFGLREEIPVLDKNGTKCGYYISHECPEEPEFVQEAIAAIYDYFVDDHEKMFKKLDLIDSARVPVIKFTLKDYPDIEVDINVNCVAGIYNSHLLFYYTRVDERFPILATFLKRVLSDNSVIMPRDGRINSYTAVLMLLHYMQCGVEPPILPNLNYLYTKMFDGTMDIDLLDWSGEFPEPLPEMEPNHMSLNELLIGFFDYYAKFDYAFDWICIRDGSVRPREELPQSTEPFLFFIEEVYDGLTVPKNLRYRNDLNDILTVFKNMRSRFLCLNFRPTIEFLAIWKLEELNKIDKEACSIGEERRVKILY